MPAELTVAIALLVLLQVPPVAVSESVMLVPVHTLDAPEIVPASGSGLTVIVLIAVAVPQPFVTW